MPKCASIEERFWEKVSPEPNSGCWLWTGALLGKGYGNFLWPPYDKMIGAHRASWLIHHGEIPNGLLVLHRCDMPQCVNPDHLFLGTYLDNARDAKRKGRLRTGEERARKLNWESVNRIRSMRHDKATLVASKFGISQSMVYAIWARENWVSDA